MKTELSKLPYDTVESYIMGYDMTRLTSSPGASRANATVAKLTKIVEDIQRPLLYSPFVVEKFGDSLRQSAWRDEGGFGMVFRVAPLDVGFVKSKGLFDVFVSRFIETFAPGCNGYGYPEVHLAMQDRDDPMTRVALVVFTSSHSIGD